MTPKPTRAALPPDEGAIWGEADFHLFNEGTHCRVYQKMGAHRCRRGGVEGVQFAVWAPGASHVSVTGNFNFWDRDANPLFPTASGVWIGFVPKIGKGEVYKYHVRAPHSGFAVDKADPYGFCHEVPPKTASVVWDLDHEWGDAEWMKTRAAKNSLTAPMSILEVHLGSWMKTPENTYLTYPDLAPRLADYCVEMGFTHVEFLPITEHPFGGSWGYQTTGFFAPTSRFGTPQEFKGLVDHLHQKNVGVILDWVPSHFPQDEHGPIYFDGTHLYEHADARQGFHPDWKSAIFNYGRNEVRAFLISSAIFWLDEYHIDGLRVDAVASMLYLDYSRKEGEWIPNRYGGNENIEAIEFLRHFNYRVYEQYPDVQTFAEESTSFSQVSRPTDSGGLGFGMKWDMGWMHDTLKYLRRDPVYRAHHHGDLTFRAIYAYSENFVLPLSHDEVVHGKGSLAAQMPGDDWQKFANLRLLYGYMYGQPGKKLLFQGDEWGQWGEWNHDKSLDWDQHDYLPGHDGHAPHNGVRAWVRDLNRVYRAEPALHQGDCFPGGFEWVNGGDVGGSVLSFLRRGDAGGSVLVVCNFTPVVREGYRVGVPHGGFWRELLNSDAHIYWGSGQGNKGGLDADAVPWNGRPFSVPITLPPLGTVFLKAG